MKRKDRIVLKTARAMLVLLLFFFAQGAIVVITGIEGIPSALIRGAVIRGLVIITLANSIIRYKGISKLGFRSAEKGAAKRIPDQDRTELVTSGIYQFSRNPAFLGFDLMYIGVMLMYCNLLTVPLTVFAIVMLHLQILQEERYLEETFGAAYREYKRHTFRYLGRR